MRNLNNITTKDAKNKFRQSAKQKLVFSLRNAIQVYFATNMLSLVVIQGGKTIWSSRNFCSSTSLTTQSLAINENSYCIISSEEHQPYSLATRH